MSYSSEVLADSPVAYYRLGETSGTTMADSSGNGRNGTYTGSYTLGATGLLVSDANKAADWTGGYGSVGDAAWQENAQATFECLINADTLGNRQIGGKDSDASPVSELAWRMTINASKLRFVLNIGGTIRICDSTTTLSTGTTYHVAMTFDGTTMKIYLNGSLDASASYSGSINTTSAMGVAIGGLDQYPSERFDGRVDEFAIYASALSAGRIAAHYTAATTAAPEVTASPTSAGAAAAAVVPVGVVAASPTSTGSASAAVVPIALASAAATSAGEATAILDDIPNVVAYPTSVGTATAEVDVVPGTDTAPGNGRRRDAYATATWDPPVVVRPQSIGPVHARVSADAYTSVDVTNGRARPVAPTHAERLRHDDRIIVAGRDITYWRGARTPLPSFTLIEPLLYGSGRLELPQIAACYETPGRGNLSWLKPGAPVLVQRINPSTGAVVATDYRGFLLDVDITGRTVSFGLAGDAVGRMALQDKQAPIFRRRNDLGWWWWNTLRTVRRPFEPAGGPVTGIKLYDNGGLTLRDYAMTLAAKGTTRTGNQWTCMPDADDTYRVRRKDLETIDGTVYLDDAHTEARLRRDPAEEPNRIYATGTTPAGMRIRFGVYPVLADTNPPPFPNPGGTPIEQGDTDADTGSGGGVTALLARLAVTGYLTVAERNRFDLQPYDAAVTNAVRDFQDDAGLPETGDVDPDTWDALFDVDVTGYSTAGSHVEPVAQLPKVRPNRRTASGNVIGPNPNYDPTALVIDRTVDYGSGVTREQMREWGRDELHSSRSWVGTITFRTGGFIDGEHTPGDPLGETDIRQARSLRPGMNLWLPLFDGGTLLHVSGVDIDASGVVTAAVDTRARDTMALYQVIKRNQDNRRDPARAWIRDHRSSKFVKDSVTEFDEIGGTITPRDLDPGWNVFPVVAGQEGTIGRLRLQLNKPAEFTVAVFGRRISRKRLAAVIGNPLDHVGAKRWTDPDRLDKLVGDRVLLYSAGDDQSPCGYYPGTKKTKSYTVMIDNPDFNVDVDPDDEDYDDQETIPEQVPNPAYDPDADPDDDGTDDDETIDRVETDVLTKLTGRWDDDAGFPYRTFDQSCILWVAIYVRRNRTLKGGRIMWPQLEAGS